jgi:hypothetical protein
LERLEPNDTPNKLPRPLPEINPISVTGTSGARVALRDFEEIIAGPEEDSAVAELVNHDVTSRQRLVGIEDHGGRRAHPRPMQKSKSSGGRGSPRLRLRWI